MRASVRASVGGHFKQGDKTHVQTVLIPKAKFPLKRARAWLKREGFKSPRPDSFGKFNRFRQSPPERFRKSSFRTIEMGSSGVKAVIGKLV